MATRFHRHTTLTVMALMLAAGPAAAQAPGWIQSAASYSRADYRAPYADAQRAAYDNGYRDGLKRGEQALRDRRAFDVQREREYRDAENGYNRSYGDRNRYRDNYRGGFTQGFRDAYQRDGYGRDGYGRDGYDPRGNSSPFPGGGRRNGPGYGRGPGYGGNAGYGAYQTGASDGYEKGLDDVGDRKYADATRHKWYRNGDHDYNNRYGSKDSYRIEYRRGFEEGYARAFRERRR
ncbi:MAG: hypothetical protein ABIQ52_01830 [Vicinamibacterales bacterium]